MHNERFFDQTLKLIDLGSFDIAMPMLAGQLHAAFRDPAGWEQTRSALHAHPLHKVLLEDPYVARCTAKPRGYAGDAVLIDMLYDQRPPAGTPERASGLFARSTAFPTSNAVRLRRDHAEVVLTEAVRQGQRVLSLACGHLREADRLIGAEPGSLVVVDQDAESLAVVRARHGDTVAIHEANVFSYLRGAIARKERFDLVYTLGLTDYLDERAMLLLNAMVKSLLAPEGSFLLANFVPHHLAVGWMDAVMDWQLIYREPEDLARYATSAGFRAETWLDPTGSIAWCKAT